MVEQSREAKRLAARIFRPPPLQAIHRDRDRGGGSATAGVTEGRPASGPAHRVGDGGIGCGAISARGSTAGGQGVVHWGVQQSIPSCPAGTLGTGIMQSGEGAASAGAELPRNDRATRIARMSLVTIFSLPPPPVLSTTWTGSSLPPPPVNSLRRKHGRDTSVALRMSSPGHRRVGGRCFDANQPRPSTASGKIRREMTGMSGRLSAP